MKNPRVFEDRVYQNYITSTIDIKIIHIKKKKKINFLYKNSIFITDKSWYLQCRISNIFG